MSWTKPQAGPESFRKPRAPTPLTPEQQEHVEKYLPLAMKLSATYASRFPHLRSDFQSEAAFGLVQATKNFDPDRNVKFAAFARIRITGALKDFLRLNQLRGIRYDLGEHVEVHGFSPLVEENEHVHWRHYPQRTSEDAFDENERIEHHLRKLPALHAAVVRGIILESKTQGQIAREMNYSKSRISIVYSEAIEILRQSTTPQDFGFDARISLPEATEPGPASA